MSEPILRGLESIQAPVLLRGLPAALAPLQGLSLAASVVMIWGGLAASAWRGGGANEDDRLRRFVVTIALIVFTFTSDQWVRWAHDGFEKVGSEMSFDTPLGVAARCWKLAMSMPELEGMLDPARKPAASPPDGTTDHVQRELENDPSAFGILRGFWATLRETTSHAMDIASRTVTGIMAVFTTGLKVILSIAGFLFIFLLLGLSALICWGFDLLRYFLLVTGFTFLPMAVAGLQTGVVSGPARQYLFGYVSILFWPVGWWVVHTGTAALFNVFLNVVSGQSLTVAAGDWVRADWKTFLSDSSAPSAWAGTVFLHGTSAPTLAFLVAGGSALGLAAWIIVGTFAAPMAVTKLMMSGANPWATVGSVVAQHSAHVARTALLAAAGGPGAIKAAASPVAVTGASAGGSLTFVSALSRSGGQETHASLGASTSPVSAFAAGVTSSRSDSPSLLSSTASPATAGSDAGSTAFRLTALAALKGQRLA